MRPSIAIAAPEDVECIKPQDKVGKKPPPKNASLISGPNTGIELVNEAYAMGCNARSLNMMSYPVKASVL